jgi:chromate transport protein ChrA
VIVSASTSFSGSAARIWKITESDNDLVKWLVLVPIALCSIFMAWSFVAIWYIIIFGLFGIFVIPFRLLTRSGRNRKRNSLQHRELLEAIRDGKMNKTAE